jgi:hypothetical protein
MPAYYGLVSPPFLRRMFHYAYGHGFCCHYRSFRELLDDCGKKLHQSVTPPSHCFNQFYPPEQSLQLFEGSSLHAAITPQQVNVISVSR